MEGRAPKRPTLVVGMIASLWQRHDFIRRIPNGYVVLGASKSSPVFVLPVELDRELNCYTLGRQKEKCLFGVS